MSDYPSRLVRLLRRALLALSAAGVAATALELAMLRHWESGVQLIPWFFVGLLAVATVLAARRSEWGWRVARWLAAAAVLGALWGVVEHARGNYDAAPLDFVYATRWDTMSQVQRWWAATTGAVGPSPMLAPLVLAQTALTVLLAVTASRSRAGANV